MRLLWQYIGMLSKKVVSPIPALKDNYIWLIKDKAIGQAIVVDPGESAPVIQALKDEDLVLNSIFLTHHHWDHSDGIPALLEEYGDIPVYGPQKEAQNLVTHPLAEQDVVDLPEWDMQYEVLEVPGHTNGHIAFYGNGHLFSGDTLFGAGCGRLFEGTADELYHSLQKLSALPADTQVYCGHEYTLANLEFAKRVEPNNNALLARETLVRAKRDQGLPSLPSTIEEERATNPFLRVSQKAVIDSVQTHCPQHSQHSSTEPTNIFAKLRGWKDVF